jgi:murein DD-endopeptidase MepM/ murein hydrolase activator NlpD
MQRGRSPHSTRARERDSGTVIEHRGVARAVLVCILAAIVVAPAGADTFTDKKGSVDARIARLNERVGRMQEREDAVRAQIAGASTQIRELSSRVGDVSAQLEPLEVDLRLRELRLNRLNRLLDLQAARLTLLRRQHAIALRRLSDRLVGLYKQDEPDTLTILFSSQNVVDVLDAVDYARRIADEDRRIASQVGAAKERVHAQVIETRRTRNRHVQEARALALRVREARVLRAELIASRTSVAGARSRQQETLAALDEQQRAELREIEALQQVSAELAAKIRAAEAGGSPGTGAPSAAGLVWPVSGPVTSGFGERWGRMHEGIDIGAPLGAPIVAAAAGTVIYAGWLGGYGNVVVIDHGNGLATAYGHQSSIAVGQGQSVSQGELIGYVGSTGHSTGPHLHFEVRVNGVAVDPLGYL